MFQSNLQVLGIPAVVIKDDENLPEECSLAYVVIKVKKAGWWQLSRWQWVLRAGIQAGQKFYRPLSAGESVWGLSSPNPKSDLAIEFICQLPSTLDIYFPQYCRGRLIKKGNGYLVLGVGVGLGPDNVAVKILRSVGLSARAFGTTDDPPPMPFA